MCPDNRGEYQVAGYGDNPGYDGPYHPSAALNPATKFAHAGDPKKQAELEKRAVEAAKEIKAENDKVREQELTTVLLDQGKNKVVSDNPKEYPRLAAAPTYTEPGKLKEFDVLAVDDVVTSQPVKDVNPEGVNSPESDSEGVDSEGNSGNRSDHTGDRGTTGSDSQRTFVSGPADKDKDK